MFRPTLLIILLMAMWASARAAQGPAELDGTVLLSPARPGPQHAGEGDTAPMSKAVVRVLLTNGNEVTRATTDDHGHFTVSVTPGDYDIVVDFHGAAFPRCQATHVVVQAGQRGEVQVMCDSGMR
ncbi:carboxypeptidase-like regulatory domain-containing protein [Dyella silvae]|uniref:carboxypeptidase-like regulatory domain-containing protein n=1 Tax=Dyella silvae TaxID=2994424 RepID=UPI0022655317|nr:carboxypeptidase-like regulatory domain-containing protein [Dyella silvae]